MYGRAKWQLVCFYQQGRFKVHIKGMLNDDLLLCQLVRRVLRARCHWLLIIGSVFISLPSVKHVGLHRADAGGQTPWCWGWILSVNNRQSALIIHQLNLISFSFRYNGGKKWCYCLAEFRKKKKKSQTPFRKLSIFTFLCLIGLYIKWQHKCNTFSKSPRGIHQFGVNHIKDVSLTRIKYQLL